MVINMMQVNLQLLARCYLSNSQPYSAYYILKGTLTTLSPPTLCNISFEILIFLFISNCDIKVQKRLNLGISLHSHALSWIFLERLNQHCCPLNKYFITSLYEHFTWQVLTSILFNMQVPGGAAGHYLLGLIYRFLLMPILLSKFLYEILFTLACLDFYYITILVY